MLLSIHLLGPFQVKLSEEPVTNFATDKVRALLAYLAMSPDRPHRREALAGLLWPEFPERSARSNLRNALANLRHVIHDSASSPPFLHSTRQTIQFNSQSDYWLDTDAFEDLLALAPALSVQLEHAVSLVRGPFLEGFTLADAAAFEEWLLLCRERFGRRVLETLDSLAVIHERYGSFDLALSYARRRVELEPWQEEGQRQLMRLLIRNGRRTEALATFEALRQELSVELGVEPSTETTRLYKQIRNGDLEFPTLAPAPRREPEATLRQPGFLKQETDAVDPPVFVAREHELARLHAHLNETLSGHGHAFFVTGTPGQGKTALLREFGWQAMAANPKLLVASGNCNAFSGIGDPYLPFREIMSMLTGNVEAGWLTGAISTVQAHRLWTALPLAIESLLDHGPQIIGPLISGQPLLSRAALWCALTTAGPQSVAWFHRLRRWVERRQAGPYGTEQSHLFQQVTSLLQKLSETHPLLLILDDLQWADTASISLLFHLVRRLEGVRILITGAYRAEEVALVRPEIPEPQLYAASSEQAEQHPLKKVLSEFKRHYGDVHLDLASTGESEQRRFVDAYLETEPNHLGEDFRRELVRRTGGHPLFTIELVRALQARGDLIQDCKGFWVEGPVLDWETLPAQVEGAIEAQIERLEPELREILTVASVEGEDFAVQVIAQVLGMEEGELQRRLVRDLARQNRLVVEQAEVQIGLKRLSRFKFSHALVQTYLYQQLSQGERRLLHGRVATALEDCYGERVKEVAVQLAYHYSKAGDDGRALHYYTQAADNAQRVYANQEAYTHYTHAIEAAKSVSADLESVIRLYLGRGRALHTLGDFEGTLADYESALQLVGSMGQRNLKRLEWRALVNLGRLWTSRDYNCALDYFQDALELAQQMDDPTLLASSLNWMGNWYLNAENPNVAITHHKKALAIFEQLGDRMNLAVTLDLLGIACLLGGDITAMVAYYNRAILLFRELDDQPNLVSSLTGRGHAGCSTYSMLTSLSPSITISPRSDFEDANRIAQRIGSLAGEAWVAWSLGTLLVVQGCYGQALEVIQRGLDIATQIEHREWIVGNRCILGFLYLELLAPEDARREFEPALASAEGLRSRTWIHNATGGLAAAHCLHDDLAEAQTCLEKVLSLHTPMDTLGIRYCWARRAELALCQGNPALALDIVDRLIISAAGMAPGRVITFLWKVKGEALAAVGEMESACSLLRAAIENARSTREQFLLWRLYASLGRLYHIMNRQSEAKKEFSHAHELIHELANTVLNGELRDNFLKRAHKKLRISQ